MAKRRVNQHYVGVQLQGRINVMSNLNPNVGKAKETSCILANLIRIVINGSDELNRLPLTNHPDRGPTNIT